MSRIRYVLLSDGSSDKMLMPILDWHYGRPCWTNQPPCCLCNPRADAGSMAPNARQHAHLVSQSIHDFALLRKLTAFQTLELELTTVIQMKGWHNLTD